MSHLLRLFSVLFLSVWAMSVCHATTATQVTASGLQTCTITDLGTVKCWGMYNGSKQIAPVDVPGIGGTGLLSGVTAITGDGFSCALLETGAVACWGSNTFGQLGDGTTVSSTVPALVKGVGGIGQLGNIVAIAATYRSVCALTRTGGVVCWGDNFLRQLGDNTTLSHFFPAPVLGVGGAGWLADITAITAGYSGHFCGLTLAGNVVCWGNNGRGQLGDNTTTVRGVPVVVQGVGGVGSLGSVAAISAGWSHTCALTATGNVLCWGDGTSGALGDGAMVQRNTPVNVLNVAGTGLLDDISSIAAGNVFTCAVTRGGQVFCWGTNYHGQLGINQASGYQVLPTPVLGLNGSGILSGIHAITTGDTQTCALTNGGDIFCWGDNFFGQLGINSATPTQVNTPVFVYGFSNPPLSLDGSYKGSSTREQINQQ